MKSRVCIVPGNGRVHPACCLFRHLSLALGLEFALFAANLSLHQVSTAMGHVVVCVVKQVARYKHNVGSSWFGMQKMMTECGCGLVAAVTTMLVLRELPSGPELMMASTS